MKINKLYLIAALLGTVLVGCQKEEKGIERPEEKTDAPTWTLTVQATKTNEAQTKALDIVTVNNKEKLNATWSAANDHVYVYTTDGTLLDGSLSVEEGDDGKASATLSGDITGNLTGVEQLTLVFPRTEWNYSTQYGLLKGENSIERLFDYATATIDVTKDNGTVTASAFEFENQQSIYRFSFRFGGIDINMKNVVLSSSNNKIVGTYDPFNPANTTFSPITLSMATATTEPVYAAIKHDDKAADTFNFTVIDNQGVTYMGSKAIPAAAFEESFVSVKNISLGQRLDAALINTEVETVL